MKLKIGDTVVALYTFEDNVRYQPIVRGEIYTVRDIMYCYRCGVQFLNFGFMSDSDTVMCPCGTISNSGRFHWSVPRLFIAATSLEDAIDQAVKNDDFELAHLLSQKL